MILCDTGPLVAIVVEDDAAHLSCTACAARQKEPLVTTDACITEAFHLLLRAGGQPAQFVLWEMIIAGEVRIASLSDESRLRTHHYRTNIRICRAIMRTRPSWYWPRSRDCGACSRSIRISERTDCRTAAHWNSSRRAGRLG